MSLWSWIHTRIWDILGGMVRGPSMDDESKTDVLTAREEAFLKLHEREHAEASEQTACQCIRRLEGEVRALRLTQSATAFGEAARMAERADERAERAEADAAEKSEALKQIEWCDASQDGPVKPWTQYCPWPSCGAQMGEPHDDDCPIGKALSGDARSE